MATLADLYGHLNSLMKHWFYDKNEMDTVLNSKSASNHTHGNLTNDGKIGTTANKPIITGTGGALTTGAFGTSSGQFAEGNHTHSNYTNHEIADNLTTNDATKVLSAKQGKILNDLIGDAITYINQ